MSVVLLTSAGHAPGVTGLGVALALTWPAPVLLVNEPGADRRCSPGTAEVDPVWPRAGWLLQAHRERRPLAECLHALTLPLASDRDAAFLPGFSHPGMVALFEPVWRDLASVLGDAGRDVVVDAGRITPAGLPSALVDAGSAVVVVTGSRLTDLAALRLYLPSVVAAAGPDRTGLVVVGPGRPYGSGEIGHRFDLPVWGKLAWAPVEAEVFAAGTLPPRRLMTSAYVEDVRALSCALTERMAGRRRVVGVAR